MKFEAYLKVVVGPQPATSQLLGTCEKRGLSGPTPGLLAGKLGGVQPRVKPVCWACQLTFVDQWLGAVLGWLWVDRGWLGCRHLWPCALTCHTGCSHSTGECALDWHLPQVTAQKCQSAGKSLTWGLWPLCRPAQSCVCSSSIPRYVLSLSSLQFRRWWHSSPLLIPGLHSPWCFGAFLPLDICHPIQWISLALKCCGLKLTEVYWAKSLLVLNLDEKVCPHSQQGSRARLLPLRLQWSVVFRAAFIGKDTGTCWFWLWPLNFFQTLKCIRADNLGG